MTHLSDQLFGILLGFLAAVAVATVRLAFWRVWFSFNVRVGVRRVWRILDAVAPFILLFAVFQLLNVVLQPSRYGVLAVGALTFSFFVSIWYVDDIERLVVGLPGILRRTFQLVFRPFLTRPGQFLLWIGIPVAAWALAILVLAWWLANGERGFHWWDRTAWLSGERGIGKTAAEIRSDELRNLVGAIAVVLGSLAAAFTLGNALRRTSVQDAERATNRDRLNSDAFFKAVEQLAADKDAVRLGGIYSLEAIAHGDNSIRRVLLRRVMETLAAFLRDRSANRTDGCNLSQTTPRTSDIAQPKTAADIEAASFVVVRSYPYLSRPSLRRASGVNLRGLEASQMELPNSSDLRCFCLAGGNLRFLRARSGDFRNADLSDSCFERSQLENSSFAGSDLSRADFRDALLGDVDFTRARVWGANFADAKLHGSKFENIRMCFNASFKSAGLRDSSFRSSWFEHANFADAFMREADLRFGRFLKCDFTNAVLAGANVRYASFDDSNLSGAVFETPANELTRRLRVRGLTAAQVMKARWSVDRPPIWPSGFIPPHDGQGKPI